MSPIAPTGKSTVEDGQRHRAFKPSHGSVNKNVRGGQGKPYSKANGNQDHEGDDVAGCDHEQGWGAPGTHSTHKIGTTPGSSRHKPEAGRSSRGVHSGVSMICKPFLFSFKVAARSTPRTKTYPRGPAVLMVASTLG